MADALGKISFLDTPDVNGNDIIITTGGVPSFSANTTANRPAAGTVGRIFIDTTVNKTYRDNGTSWDDLTGLITLTPVANQISITQATSSTPAIIGLASDAILPGTSGFVPPTGTTAQRPACPTTGIERFNSTLGYHEIYNGSSWLPQGKVLQISTSTIAAQSFSSTQIPVDSTIPQNTEGSQIWTQTFTPLSSDSRIIVNVAVTVSHGTAGRIIILALFNGTVNAIATSSSIISSANSGNVPALQYSYAPGSTAPITFSLRVGSNGSGAVYVNQLGTNTLGGTLASTVTITEVL